MNKVFLASLLAATATAHGHHGHHEHHGGYHGWWVLLGDDTPAITAGPSDDQMAELKEACAAVVESSICSEVAAQQNLAHDAMCLLKYHAQVDHTCVQKFKELYPALFVCASEVASVCPQVGDMTCHHEEHDAYPVEPIGPPPKDEHGHPVPPPTIDETRSDQDDPNHWGMTDRNQQRMKEGPRCLAANMATFSPHCQSAIREQWNPIKEKLGLPADYEPLPSDVYAMFSPPASHYDYKSAFGLIIKVMICAFAMTLMCWTCFVGALCCCYHRKRPASRSSPASNPVGAPPQYSQGGYAQLSEGYIPYTGQGYPQSAPLAQPVAHPMTAPVAYQVQHSGPTVHAVPVAMPL